MRNRYINSGWVLTLIVALIPALLWLILVPDSWNSSKTTLENLGNLAGIIGLALFAWNVVLSARFKIYNRLFRGLDNTYRAHHVIGAWAFILLLIHPVLITLRYFLISPISAYEFIKPSLGSPFRLVGSVALGLLFVLMIVTLYLKVKYEWFIIAQRLLGFVLFIGATHAIFVGGSSLNPNGGKLALQIYFGILILMGAFIYLYRSIFHGNFSRFYDYRLTSKKISGDIYELTLSPVSEEMFFKPGQYSFIKTTGAGILSQSHPFSMSSDPNDHELKFGIKVLGDYTEALKGVAAATVFKIDGPYGTFSNKIVRNHRQVWIAGGIGVTPFMSMSKDLDKYQQVDLFYSTISPSEAFYLKELRSIASKKPNLRLHYINSEKDGFITVDMVFSKCKDLENANFMICGPAAMMTAIKKQLRIKGVKRRNINTEEFNLA